MRIHSLLCALCIATALPVQALEMTDGTDVDLLGPPKTNKKVQQPAKQSPAAVTSTVPVKKPSSAPADAIAVKPKMDELDDVTYYTKLRDRIEKAGSTHFPKLNGKKLYGELEVTIPIYQDGTIYDKKGGPRIERSSGNAALDKATLGIVRRAAPFPVFPAGMRERSIDGVTEFTVPFSFTLDERKSVRTRKIQLK